MLLPGGIPDSHPSVSGTVSRAGRQEQGRTFDIPGHCQCGVATLVHVYN